MNMKARNLYLIDQRLWVPETVDRQEDQDTVVLVPVGLGPAEAGECKMVDSSSLQRYEVTSIPAAAE